LKTENFLLVGEPGSPAGDVLKLCDFGTAVVLSREARRSMEDVGTLSYKAPEIYSGRGAAVAADVWSLGVVLYTMVTGKNPFRLPGDNRTDEIVRRIKAGDFQKGHAVWQRLGAKVHDLIERLLVLDEQRRFTCLQALKHPWLGSKQRPMLATGLSDPPGLGEHIPRLLELLLRVARMEESQRLALGVCALAASEGDVSSSGVPWRELFIALDEDCDGQLSPDEFADGLRRLATGSSLQDERIEEAAMALDLDHNGFVDWTEFLTVAVLGSGAISETPEPIATAFRLLDRHNLEGVHMDAAAEDAGQVGQAIRSFVAQASPADVAAGSPQPQRLELPEFRSVLHSTDPFEMM